jgi:hypothetical protein
MGKKKLKARITPSGAIVLKPKYARIFRMENAQEYAKLRQRDRGARANIAGR